MQLSDLPHHTLAIVVSVQDAASGDPIAARLRDLGFVKGEPVRVTTHGPMGKDPLLVQVGFTRFALRRAEAARITVEPAGADV